MSIIKPSSKPLVSSLNSNSTATDSTKSSTSVTPTISSSWPKQLALEPFDIDQDDAYHFLLAELSPVDLQDIPEPDLGDLNHPAATRSQSNTGLFNLEYIQSLVSPVSPQGPLYTPEDALHLATPTGVANRLS